MCYLSANSDVISRIDERLDKKRNMIIVQGIKSDPIAAVAKVCQYPIHRCTAQRGGTKTG